MSERLGIVIRADGTVPFDKDCDPVVRAMILAHLMDQGHSLVPVKDSTHVTIAGWAAKQADMPIQDASLNTDGTAQAVDAAIGVKI